MNTEIRELSPKLLWNKFADLNAVPRPSKKEDLVIAFMADFGKRLNLETIVDHVGNVIIRKPATSGMEHKAPIVMQSHLDMVHQKNKATIFDFETEGIQMFIQNDWVKANGTTLGADNGIGVATIMAILESSDIAHPAIEALFTIDEETGMTGAKALKGGLLSGEILLNLDTEEDNEICIGCAGGVDITATRTYEEEQTPNDMVALQITVKGLQGGHSGIQIHEGLGNANKIMNRILYCGMMHSEMRISSIDGGSLRNAIPRESHAIIVINKNENTSFNSKISEEVERIKVEFKTLEPELDILLVPTEMPKYVMPLAFQQDVIKGLYAALNGVYKMSADIPDLVETSNNIARVCIKDGQALIGCLTRSSVESSKTDLVNTLVSVFELAHFNVECSGDYPGWTPNVNSEILNIATQLYQDLNDSKPHVSACHAGLECGILGTHYPEMDMISFGPNIKGAHSPDERVQISSVQKYWGFVLELLKQIPEKRAISS